MIKYPYSCPRGRTDCIALSRIESDDGTTFFCCGENNGKARPVAQDVYTVCMKGPHRDDMCFYDKRDLVHNAAVLMQAIAVVERVHGGSDDWSPWRQAKAKGEGR
jgi:hypothetical protein